MSRGTQNGQDLAILRVFERPGHSPFSQLTVFIKDDAILPVDRALASLKEAYPGASISELVAGAVVAAGAKAKRLNRQKKQSG